MLAYGLAVSDPEGGGGSGEDDFLAGHEDARRFGADLLVEKENNGEGAGADVDFLVRGHGVDYVPGREDGKERAAAVWNGIAYPSSLICR